MSIVRRTSIYSLRVATRTPNETLDQMVNAMSGPVQDSHTETADGRTWAAVGFRAADDSVARDVARDTLMAAGLNPNRATLWTGFGQARREVAW